MGTDILRKAWLIIVPIVIWGLYVWISEDDSSDLAKDLASRSPASVREPAKGLPKRNNVYVGARRAERSMDRQNPASYPEYSRETGGLPGGTFHPYSGDRPDSSRLEDYRFRPLTRGDKRGSGGSPAAFSGQQYDGMSPPAYSGQQYDRTSPPAYSGQQYDRTSPPAYSGQQYDRTSPPAYSGQQYDRTSPPAYSGQQYDRTSPPADSGQQYAARPRRPIPGGSTTACPHRPIPDSDTSACPHRPIPDSGTTACPHQPIPSRNTIASPLLTEVSQSFPGTGFAIRFPPGLGPR